MISILKKEKQTKNEDEFNLKQALIDIFKGAHIDLNKYPISLNTEWQNYPTIGIGWDNKKNKLIIYKITNPDLNYDLHQRQIIKSYDDPNSKEAYHDFCKIVANYINEFEGFNFEDPSIILMTEDETFDQCVDKFQTDEFHLIFTMKTITSNFKLFNEFKYLVKNSKFREDDKAIKIEGVSAVQIYNWLKDNYYSYQPEHLFVLPFRPIYEFMVYAHNNPKLMTKLKELMKQADKIKAVYPNVDQKMEKDPKNSNKYRQIDGYFEWYKIEYQIETLFKVKDIF